MVNQAATSATDEAVSVLFPGSSRHDAYADPRQSTPAVTPVRGDTAPVDEPQAEDLEDVLTAREPVMIPVESSPEPTVIPVESRSPEVARSTSSEALEGAVMPGELLSPQDAAAAQATTSRASWKAWLAKFGLAGGAVKAPSAEETAEQTKWETIIRQSTWVRAVNIAVVTGKGGNGCTPAALIVGGILADIRGGSVAIFEATVPSGALTGRAEGNPKRGLGELLAGADLISSAGNLAGYTAPQTSYAAVIGSVGSRPQLTPAAVRITRGVLDTYYQLTVADMDHNLNAPSSLAAQRSADAAIVPTIADARSLTDAVATVAHLQKTAEHLFTGNVREPGPVVVVLGHSGAPEDPNVTAMALVWLQTELRGLAWVIEAPYEPIFGGDHEVTLSKLSGPSRRAWTHATGLAVKHITGDEPTAFEGDNT